MSQPEPATEEPPTPLRADARRHMEQILDAAAHVLSENPGASMQAIAEHGQLSRGTVYRHFSDRGQLLQALHRRALNEAREAIEAAEPERGPAIEALRRVIESVLAVGDRYRFVASERRDDPGLREVEEEVGVPLVALIDRGQRAGEIRDRRPPRVLAAHLGGLISISIEEINRGDVTLAEAGEAAWDTFVNGVAARRD